MRRCFRLRPATAVAVATVAVTASVAANAAVGDRIGSATDTGSAPIGSVADTATAPIGSPAAAVRAALAPLDPLLPELESLYRDLHRAPELSKQEAKTSALLARRMRALGFEVTTGVGGHGIVAVLRNGAGPTALLRTDLDALPVEERTGLPFASRATATDREGSKVAVMHACGHDVHMTSWLGAATLLARAKARWRGTLVMVGQPAEELGTGAKAMIADGLFTRFPRPDHAVALHVSGTAAAGTVEHVSGYALANVDSVDVTIFGRGGHGAAPHAAIDPVVIASRTVLALQTIVSRENDPLDPAVVTVGAIHGGTKHNIIPDRVTLKLTVRSYRDDVRRKLLDAIRRIVKAEASAAGAPREPEVTVEEGPSATYNDPALTRRLAGAIATVLGESKVVEGRPVMGAEDFGELARAGIPSSLLWLGAADPAAIAAKEPLPSLHSPLFAPKIDPALRTGITALTAAALEILGRVD